MPDNNDPIPTSDRAAKVQSAIDGWNDQLASDSRREKYDKMKSSAFIFYRGTNHLFWEDFAADARLGQFGNEFTRTWLQGDLHVENFGAFGNDEGEVVYDINDYDEAVIADYQYDLWRMAVSIVLVARQDDNTKLSDKDQAEVIDAFASSYLDQLRSYVKKDGSEDTMVLDASNTDGPLAAFLKDPKKKRSRVKMLDDWTELAGGGRRFDLAGSKGKLVDVSDSRRSEILQGIGEYEATLVKQPKNHRSGYFEVKDVARRLLAGTGSLGVQRFYVLIAGADDSPQSVRILDIKCQLEPTAYHFLGSQDRVEYEWLLEEYLGRDARWHEAAYRAMAKYTDDHLGWMELSDGFYSVRERSFFQETFATKGLDRAEFVGLAEQWGKILATDHSRALTAFNSEYPEGSDRQFMPRAPRFKQEVVAKTANRHDEFRALVRKVAFDYAKQVKADWDAFIK
jgi:uncharacterized protein (DUF2252 family)